MKLFCKHSNLLEHVEDIYGDKINFTPRNARSIWRCRDCDKTFYKNYLSKDIIYTNGNIGKVSDGYHTFNELYHHRAILFSIICNANKENAWKSLKHDTGDMFEGMFIVGIETPQGQATYHYDVEPYWEMFNVKELGHAPKWDGHTPQEALTRLLSLVNKHGALVQKEGR